jgi:hypothetical protein
MEVLSILLTPEWKDKVQEVGHHLMVRKDAREHVAAYSEALAGVWGLDKTGSVGTVSKPTCSFIRLLER